MAYSPIEDYGIIGDMQSAALVSRHGSIDWLCWPIFDSPSIFGRILDDRKGGHFTLQPESPDTVWKQFYWPDTNVLVTRCACADGVAEIEDFMPLGQAGAFPSHAVVRRIRGVRGRVTFDMVCSPAFQYALEKPHTSLHKGGAVFESMSPTTGPRLALLSQARLTQGDQGVKATVVVGEGESQSFLLMNAPDAGALPALTEEQVQTLFESTVTWWRRWLSACTYEGRWREQVNRSALALKLLTYQRTGAVLAAASCSLPETLGGPRNWDYRYTWMRDAAFTIYGLMRVGFHEEATGFMQWMSERCREADREKGLQIVYGIDGRSDLTERTLDHLAGYRGSRPVRVGNGAFQQLQLDIYGEILDSAYLYNKYGAPLSYDTWVQLRELLEYVCDHWTEKDEGIWEVRNARQHFVYSKLMCWVAVDRGLRLAEKRSFPANRARWLATRDAIYESILNDGWNPKLQTFVQAYGSSALDASNLIMPLVFFMAPNDPRMLRTIEAIRRPPDQGGLLCDGLVYRYDPQKVNDGVGGEEGTFNMCSFWLVEAMTRAGRTNPLLLDEARLLFERMLGFSNHLGLYAEETGPRGDALGNFPQAFAHLALISAAFNLDRALGHKP